MTSIHLLHVFPSLEVGGSQRRFVQLANAFGARYRHTLFATDGNYAAAAMLQPEVSWRRLPDTIDKARGLANIPLLRRILARERPDRLLTYNWGSIEWALGNRWLPLCRHVHTEDGFGPEETVHQLPRRVLFRRLALGGRHTRIVLPSHRLHDIALKVWRLPEARVILQPNGVDVSRFSVARSVDTNGTPIVGTVAGLRPEKNVGRLLRAFAQAATQRKMRLVIVGDGVERAKLEAEAAELKIADATEFVGNTERPQDHLARMNVFCLSSDTEQMPLGILEAMASCLPIASVDVGDVRRMVAAENLPFIVPAGDTDALTKAMLGLCDDPDLAARIAAANLSRVKSVYTLQVMVDAYDRLFSRSGD